MIHSSHTSQCYLDRRLLPVRNVLPEFLGIYSEALAGLELLGLAEEVFSGPVHTYWTWDISGVHISWIRDMGGKLADIRVYDK